MNRLKMDTELCVGFQSHQFHLRLRFHETNELLANDKPLRTHVILSIRSDVKLISIHNFSILWASLIDSMRIFFTSVTDSKCYRPKFDVMTQTIIRKDP